MPYACTAMVLQHPPRDLVAELQNPHSSHRMSVNLDNSIDQECSVCFENMAFGNRQRLACGHKYHRACIESLQQCPLCLRAVQPVEDFQDPVPAQQARLVEPMQVLQPARPAQPVERLEQAEQRIQLTPRQQEILQQLIRELSRLDRDDVTVLLIDAYDNPLVLANGDFMDVLTSQQRALAHEFIDLAIDPQVAEQPARPVQPAADAQEQALIAQLALELDRLVERDRDTIEDTLIQAYTNPYALVQNPTLTNILNNQQKAFVDHILSCYTKRITQQD